VIRKSSSVDGGRQKENILSNNTKFCESRLTFSRQVLGFERDSRVGFGQIVTPKVYIGSRSAYEFPLLDPLESKNDMSLAAI